MFINFSDIVDIKEVEQKTEMVEERKKCGRGGRD